MGKGKVRASVGPRLRILGLGCALLIIFLASTVICSGIFIGLLIGYGFKETFTDLWIYPVAVIIIENIIFWTGIIMVYLTGKQIGIKIKILGIIVGMIPVLHLIALGIILKISLSEYFFEKKKIKLDTKRKDQQICKTKYPLLMVHGIFFRDFKRFNYWGRVPAELIKNGATIYYGNHESAETVEKSAMKLVDRIREIVEKENCGKLNIIAHSKGGLDMKY
nr:triacylglycerol lipase [Clostridiales bacterium]